METSSKGTSNNLIDCIGTMTQPIVIENTFCALTPKDEFAPNDLNAHLLQIRNYASQFAVESILDYGCGSADLYQDGVFVADSTTIKDYWEIDDIILYDPKHTKYAELCVDNVDMVICTNVLEHLTFDELVSTLEHIGKLSTKCVYISISTMNQENNNEACHNCLWWSKTIAKYLDKPFFIATR